jgi:rubredoxin
VAAGRGSVGRPGLSSSPGPGRSATAARVPSGPMTTTTVQKWICQSCGFIYDPSEGDPDGGIPPGTAFDDIPSDWFCPVCGARKADFEPFED